MAGIIQEVKYFWTKKCFAVGIPLMTLLSYLTLIINPTVSEDDTAFRLYYVEGVSPAMGRWCLYLVNKLFPLDYNPHFVEACGLAVFCLSVTLWCAVFHRMFGERVSALGYTVFGAVMLSSPILSEVVVWYLQDGIYMGYGFTALAVLFGMEAFRKGKAGCENRAEGKKTKWGGCLQLVISAAFLTAALGCYEAFMIVYLMAAVMNFLLIRGLGREDYDPRPSRWLVKTGAACVLAMVFRELVIGGLVLLFGLEEQRGVLATRGILDILKGFGSGQGDLWLVLKEFFVKYYIHGLVYVPVFIAVLAVGILVIWALAAAVRRRDGWVFAAAAGIILLPWLMVFLEGRATYYRASEYVPLLTGFAVLLLAYEVKRLDRRPVRAAALFLALVLLYRQGYEMNKWLYIDAMKYEDDRRTASAVALELIRTCDEGKPVCVVGNYRTPPSLLDKLYTPSWSKKYMLVKWLAEAVDGRIFEKYDTPYGYAAAETPQLSMLGWASQAFFGTDRELVKFWRMLGFEFAEDGNAEHYLYAKELMREAPAWPKEGSIVELEDYIIVNFGDFD